MVKKKFATPQGIVERDLTPEEEQKFREIGDFDVMREDYDKATTTAQKVIIIAKLLGLE